MGDQVHLHHLHAWSVEKLLGDHKNMDLHAQEAGRYKIAPARLEQIPETDSTSTDTSEG